MKAYWEPLAFELPESAASWRGIIDSSAPCPDDFVPLAAAVPCADQSHIELPTRSMHLLLATAPLN